MQLLELQQMYCFTLLTNLLCFSLQVHTYSVLIAHCNSSLNSILYGVTNIEFRRGYIRLLRLEGYIRARRLKQGRTAAEESVNTQETRIATVTHSAMTRVED